MIATGAQLLASLADHEPVDDREARSLARIRALLAWLADPFSEQADPAHVTASGIVVDEHLRLLLHRHRRLGTWLQPGGHVDVGETLEDAVRREVREEAGLATTHTSTVPCHVDVHEGPRGHLHLDIRWLLTADGAATLRPGPGESPVIGWFSLGEAATIVDDGLRGAVTTLSNRPARGGLHQTAR